MFVVDRRAVVERGKDPVVDAAHVIDELVLSKRGAASDAVGPDEVAADAGVMPVIEAEDDQVGRVFRNLLVVFGEDFASSPHKQVSAYLLRVVVDQLGTQAAPVDVAVLVGEAVVVDGQVDPVVEAVDDRTS